ncbi:MAG: AmmeMemoRadiSam system protein B [Burkholderiales bacterium]
MQTLAHRPPAVAGRFYPADPDALRAGVERMLDEARAVATPIADRPPKLLVVPHAGHVFSGACAARAWALLPRWRDRFRRVVLLGPTHRVAMRAMAVPTVAAFETPLGAVPVDREAVDALLAMPGVVADDRPHAEEHALEVQLPFLQAVLERVPIVPIAVGDVDPAAVRAVIERLWGGDETLIVVSTDLSHYLTDERARAIDAVTAERILRMDDTIGHHAACGATPLDGALRAARAHGLHPVRLDVRTSADAGAGVDGVVGYGAFAFWPPAADDPEPLGRALLARARNALAASLGLPGRLPEPGHPALARPGATFVTLTRGGRLRGCIGRFEPGPHPLEDDVRRNACRAAFEDPRFPPLTAAEWPGLTVEVSLLGAIEPLGELDEAAAIAVLRPGVDGVILDAAGRRSTFLPQVWSQIPEPRDFLAALREKAGLPRDPWVPGSRLSRYPVTKFAEERPR